MYDYKEIYRGYSIAIPSGISSSRFAAVITDKNCGFYGSGIGHDINSAVRAAKNKINNMPKLKEALSYDIRKR